MYSLRNTYNYLCFCNSTRESMFFAIPITFRFIFTCSKMNVLMCAFDSYEHFNQWNVHVLTFPNFVAADTSTVISSNK